MVACFGLWFVVPRSHASRTRCSWLALGDSYTIGQSVDAGLRYPVLAAQKLSHSGMDCAPPQIIAATGWTTGNLLDAIAAAAPTGPYSFVTLLIGVNNQFQGRSIYEYETDFGQLLQKSIALTGNKASHVLVLSIPDYSVTPWGRSAGNGADIAAQIDSFNAVNRRVTHSYGARYLDITAESRKGATDTSLIAVDGLHYSGKEYAIWAQMMTPVMAQMNRGD